MLRGAGEPSALKCAVIPSEARDPRCQEGEGVPSSFLGAQRGTPKAQRTGSSSFLGPKRGTNRPPSAGVTTPSASTNHEHDGQERHEGERHVTLFVRSRADRTPRASPAPRLHA